MFFRCLIDFPREHPTRLQGCFEKPCAVLEAWHLDEVQPLLRQVEACAQKGFWAVGMLAYEAAAAFDPAFRTQAAVEGLPLAVFAIFDHDPVAVPSESGDFTASRWQHDTSPSAFEKTVLRIRDDIAAGNYYQTNFTTRLHADFSGDPEALFRELCKAQPESYAFFLDAGAWQLASVSPELFFSWQPRTGAITTRPMKGTAARGGSAEALIASVKDRAENLMIVDLLRNDLSRIANDVKVPELFAVQELPTALQMTSTITGKTRPEVDLYEIFSALFPCGSITGAPKVAAMQAIAGYETSPRGAYCGALGVVEPGGASTFSVGIRGVTIMNKRATCGIGSGITWDSKPAEEYAEGQVKQRFLWRASAGFDLLETLRLEDGRYWLLQRHMERLRRSAAYFGFILDEQAVLMALDDVAKRNCEELWRVRLLVNRCGAIKIEQFPLEATAEAVTVCLASEAVASDDEFLRHKTTQRDSYDKFAPKHPHIFDTLLYNERGELTEFTRGNVAVEIDGQLVTPPEHCGLLPGTLRAELLAKGTLREGVITRDDLLKTPRMWFLNGVRGMIVARHEGYENGLDIFL